MKINNGQVLRLYTDDLDTAKIMRGQYEYDPVNVKLTIPKNYYFRKDSDSLYFYKPVNSDPSKIFYIFSSGLNVLHVPVLQL